MPGDNMYVKKYVTDNKQAFSCWFCGFNDMEHVLQLLRSKI